MGTLIVFEPEPHDIATEFDYCSLCGAATTLYISFRITDMLVNACGSCIGDLKVGYDEMLVRRMRFDIIGRDET